MNIPTVTNDDLLAFHAKHFPSTTQPAQPQYEAPSQNHEESYDAAIDYLDLGPPLGYYPDGTPRYLTDEHIAIMRHTELWTAYKNMYLKPAENPDSPQSPATDSPASEESQPSDRRSTSPDEVRKLKRPGAEKRSNPDALPYDDDDVEAWEAAAASAKVDSEEEAKRKRVKTGKSEKGMGNGLLEKKGAFVWPVLGVVPKEV
ncbi:hypothetical protein BJ508DRAFT_416670 [Ascobolus immersus RN42]|uniref:Uncharacterized protein n=1 Tax=Ascobolus immersus RN42 TaxID=1160509 RepID=A0A3N4HYF7_ASCIM|nr:hypothetical protein BJ508DRAFT_416670 [Ascobolus immersus RN42]